MDTNGIITTVAGGPNTAPNEVDGGPPTGVNVGALDVAVDSSGNLYIYGGNSGLQGYRPFRRLHRRRACHFRQRRGQRRQLPAGHVANSWVTIQGTNLAGQTDDWSHSIVNGALPTTLDGVSVSMGGQAAYIYYISPGQLNVLAPDVPAGPVTVTVKAPGGTSASFTATADAIRPAFFVWPANQVVATRTDYSYAVKAGTFAGATTVRRQARRRDRPMGHGIRPHDAGSTAGRGHTQHHQLPDGNLAGGDGRQHSGDCLWRGASARFGRSVPDRHPGANLAQRRRLAHPGEHRRHSVACWDNPLGSPIVRYRRSL